MKVKTRFAPSPTGYLHIGGARTALFSWLYARRHGGVFVLRIEDTDRERSTEESINVILEGMAWLGLDYDEGPFYQTQRFGRYREVAQQLLEAGKAYRCFCSKDRLEALRESQMARREKPRYDGRCRHLKAPPPDAEGPPVVRFKNPVDGEVIVNDQVRGRVVFQNAELDDLIIARADGTPTYNFTVVVDDVDMAITHIVRGDDHLNNTPRQINIYRALGAETPVFAHVPMILGEDGKKLSKRHGAASVLQYRDDGFLPEAVINYLARLGWSHGDQEVFSLEELIALFDIAEINNSASALNMSKLLWLNQHYLKNSAPAHVARHLSPHMGARGIDPSSGPSLEAIVDAQRERAKTLVEMADNSLFFYCAPKQYDEKAARKNLNADALPVLRRLRDELGALGAWEREVLHERVNSVAGSMQLKLGKVAQPLRVALAGGPVSPPIDITLYLLGREETLRRIDAALCFIEAGLGGVDSGG